MSRKKGENSTHAQQTYGWVLAGTSPAAVDVKGEERCEEAGGDE